MKRAASKVRKWISLLRNPVSNISGLLLGAPLADETTIINVVGKKAVSWPYVALTLNVMEDFRIKFQVQIRKNGMWKKTDWRKVEKVVPGEIRFVVEPSKFERDEYRVEGDWSNASYFLAAGAVGNNPVKIDGMNVNSLQGDKAIMYILESMGAKIESDEHSVTVYPSNLHGVEVDMSKCPDLVPTVAMVAAFADSPTTITNVATCVSRNVTAWKPVLPRSCVRAVRLRSQMIPSPYSRHRSRKVNVLSSLPMMITALPCVLLFLLWQALNQSPKSRAV